MSAKNTDVFVPHRDGTQLIHFVDAIASNENVRIAPSLRSQKGAIWSKNPINFDYWEADISFRITGRGRIGADGLVRRL